MSEQREQSKSLGARSRDMTGTGRMSRPANAEQLNAPTPSRKSASDYQQVLVRGKVPVTRRVQGVCNRLRDHVDEIESLEQRLAAAKKRRAQLILKLRHAGLSLREIEPIAGMTNARISQIEQEAKR